MKPALKPLLVGASLAAGVAMFAVACGDRSPLPVSPSTVSVSGIDGSAVKGTRNFCVDLRAHESAGSVYVVGQQIWLSTAATRPTAAPVGDEYPSMVSRPPHGEACFAVPATQEYVYLYIDYQTEPPAESYCIVNWVRYEVHSGPSYIWLLPLDGTHTCPYPDEL